MSDMGNKSSVVAMKFSDYFGLHGDKNDFRGSTMSEEDYQLMSLEMKKLLVGSRKFRHFLPGKGDGDKKEEREKEITVNKLGSGEEVHTSKTSNNKEELKERQPAEDDWEEPSALDLKIEPVVTVVNMASLARPGTGLQEENSSSLGERTATTKSSPAASPRLYKSPQPTNRKYSMIDIKTGHQKSQFTLELEEKLRQSKLELGFDADLEDWKEFTFKMEKPEAKKRPKAGKTEEEVTETQYDPARMFPHTCQILGLCSLGRNEGFQNHCQKIDPSAGKDEITRETSFVDGDPEPAKRKVCDCDVCTLAYLTGMGFPSQCENLVDKRRVLNETNRHDKYKDRKERMEIFDVKDKSKSIKVSVFNQELSEASCSSPSFTSEGSLDGDCTNLKIKKMFQKNTRGRGGGTEINNKYLTYDDVSTVVNRSGAYYPNLTPKFSPRQGWSKSPDRFGRKSRPLAPKRTAVFGHSSWKKGPRFATSSTTGVSISSSLSTVLSYRRVRQIFQNFIEKNCSRKKVRKNINKFREMEELGLGEVKNNRWYPSGTKTVSIWNDIHSNVRGCQAEFKKFPKVSSMPLK